MTDERYRVLIAKPGLDGHDRGAKVVARALRDAGLEVIYTGLHQTPAMIAQAAVQEDVDLVGVSILSGAHNHLVPEIQRELAERGAGDIAIFVGGIIPDDDIATLEAGGVAKVFTPGATLDEIVRSVREILAGQRGKKDAYA
ncbi:MAG: cobalamin B12-binding domain-containing protein [Myxococcales bacterium]|nr:cobalamin B12-binding domain-containing protein [Myxococcales bacterium]MCB9733484.1 cobalamin B12-binding domain-containing protein [Deltaproteobacteria bacterium]